MELTATTPTATTTIVIKHGKLGKHPFLTDDGHFAHIDGPRPARYFLTLENTEQRVGSPWSLTSFPLERCFEQSESQLHQVAIFLGFTARLPRLSR